MKYQEYYDIRDTYNKLSNEQKAGSFSDFLRNTILQLTEFYGNPDLYIIDKVIGEIIVLCQNNTSYGKEINFEAYLKQYHLPSYEKDYENTIQIDYIVSYLQYC